MTLKVTTWNLEYCYKLIRDNTTNKELERRQRVHETIKEINPDILCIQEGPSKEEGINKFSALVLNNEWVPVFLPPNNNSPAQRNKKYKTKGSQWIWFLVKPDLLPKCRIQEPQVWDDWIGSPEWEVHYWGKIPSETHSHYRHPQVLIYKHEEGSELELIGVHLKSRYNRKTAEWDQGNLVGPFLETALKNRVKLATEARNIRSYISEKYEQLVHPAIMVLGDCNDGPGHDYFEKMYLFFDLISNIQGDVMISDRFFNHALFDFRDDLAWTAQFRDRITYPNQGEVPMLLDHILMSQAICQEHFPLQANPHAGCVEHQAYMRHNSGATANAITSDHRPVSIILEPLPPPQPAPPGS